MNDPISLRSKELEKEQKARLFTLIDKKELQLGLSNGEVDDHFVKISKSHPKVMRDLDRLVNSPGSAYLIEKRFRSRTPEARGILRWNNLMRGEINFFSRWTVLMKDFMKFNYWIIPYLYIFEELNEDDITFFTSENIHFVGLIKGEQLTRLRELSEDQKDNESRVSPYFRRLR